MAKYGMSMCVLGMAEEFKDEGVSVNALWPKTGMWTTVAKKQKFNLAPPLSISNHNTRKQFSAASFIKQMVRSGLNFQLPGLRACYTNH